MYYYSPTSHLGGGHGLERLGRRWLEQGQGRRPVVLHDVTHRQREQSARHVGLGPARRRPVGTKCDHGIRTERADLGILGDWHLLKWLQYSTIQYGAVQYSTVQYNTVRYSTVQYGAVQYREGRGWSVFFFLPNFKREVSLDQCVQGKMSKKFHNIL